jgi:hypothetical protein
VSNWLPEVSPAREAPEPAEQADRTRAAVAVIAIRVGRSHREHAEGGIMKTLSSLQHTQAKTGWDCSAG